MRKPIVFRTSLRLLFIIAFTVFLSICSFGLSVFASSTDVVSLAQKHQLEDVRIVSKKKGLVCEVDGKVLKKTNYWFSSEDNVYYCNKNGYIESGQFTYKNRKYRASSKGCLFIDQLVIRNGYTYYYGKDGAMVTEEWTVVNGTYRYFDDEGRMLKNQWVGEYYVDWSGSMVEGLKRQKTSSQSTENDYYDNYNNYYNNQYYGRSGGSGNAAGYGWAIKSSKKKHLIIIGASRVVGMSEAVESDSKVTFIACGGKGLSWFKNYALPLLDIWLCAYPKSIIVIQLGNNGLRYADQDFYYNYMQAYQQVLSTYPDNKVYFMDILPGDLKTRKTTNKKRKTFNKMLAEYFPSNYLGGYDYMVKKGFSTIDGTHYDDATYRMIYAYILKKIGW